MLQRANLKTHFNLDGTPYVERSKIGRGAFGVVCKAVEEPSQRQVAIKKIPCAFLAATLAKRSLREVRILKHIKHENIVSLIDVFTAASHNGQRDIYIVMNLMETDLHQIIHSPQALHEQHYEYFLYQILRGLKYLHSVGIVHRDLKPSNILVNSDCLLQIADFGLARSIDQCNDNAAWMTMYVATRWYRAPEILFSVPTYDMRVDIWSAGIIFAEMILRRQVFPGKDIVSQVKMIVCILGTPEDELMAKITAESVREWIRSCGAKTQVPWALYIPKANPRQLEVIEKMLAMSPWKRCSAEEALALPYFSTYHDPNIEPNAPRKIFIDADAIEHLPTNELRRALDEEAASFEQVRGPYANRTALPPLDYSEAFPYTDPTDIPGMSFIDQIPVEALQPGPSNAGAAAAPAPNGQRLPDSVEMYPEEEGSSGSSGGASSASSTATVKRMEIGRGDENSAVDFAALSSMAASTSTEMLSRAEAAYPGCSTSGVVINLDDTSGYASAPAGISHGERKSSCARKNLLKERLKEKGRKKKTIRKPEDDPLQKGPRPRLRSFARKISDP